MVYSIDINTHKAVCYMVMWLKEVRKKSYFLRLVRHTTYDIEL